MNAKFTLEKLRKKYRMFSTRFASFKTIVGNVSIGITENAFFSDLMFGTLMPPILSQYTIGTSTV